LRLVTEIIRPIEGITVHIVPTDKFKTLTFAVQFRGRLKRETVTKRALLAYVLKSATAKSPSTQLLQQRLDDLYGASLTSQIHKRGEDHILSFLLHTAGDRFLSETSTLAADSLELLAEAILAPHAKDGAFDEETVNKEKRALRQRLESIIDDKMQYANIRLIDEMCRGEAYALHTYGYKEDLEAISPVDLYDYYQQMIKEDEIDLYVIGDVDPDRIIGIIVKAFAFRGRQPVAHPFRFVPVEVGAPKTIRESHDVEQGKLNLGYRTNVVIGDPLYYAAQVFNGLFGGFPHSKLFMNVREKASLAYYAASRYDSYKGLILVMSGIEFSNFDKTVAIIRQQLESVQSGDFDDVAVDQTKALLKNAVLEALDSPFSLIEQLYRSVLVKSADDLDRWLTEIDRVSRDDIVRVAQQTVLDTIYFLHGKEGDPHGNPTV